MDSEYFQMMYLGQLFGGQGLAWVQVALLACLEAVSPGAWANVYATNARLDGSPTNAEVQISYLLNEPASAGVSPGGVVPIKPLIQAARADVMVVAAYGLVLPPEATMMS